MRLFEAILDANGRAVAGGWKGWISGIIECKLAGNWV
jgi:hypothetical protein